MKPIEFEQLERSTVAFRNAIFLHNRGVMITAASERYFGRVTSRQTTFVGVTRLDITIAGEQYSLLIERLPLTKSLEETLAGEDYLSLPVELRRALHSALFDDVQQQLERLMGRDVTLEVIDEPEGVAVDGNGEGLGIQIRREGDDKQINGLLTCSGGALALLCERIGQEEYPGNGLDADALPFCIRFEVGRVDLSVDELRGLETHDILFMESSAFESGGVAQIRIGSHEVARGLYKNNEVRIIALGNQYMEEAVDMEHDNGGSMPDEIGSETLTEDVVDSLQVNVRFDVGNKVLSLGEIKQLQEGYVFELEQGTEKPVTIRANGKAIGVGEFVQVGDRLGVRIMELSK